MQQREPRSAIKNSFVHLSRNAEQNSAEYKVINVSRGGLCFQSSDEFELNEKVKLTVIIKEEEILMANGRVCYQQVIDGDSSSNYGLSFLDKFIDADYLRQQK